jgi:alanine racemase
MNSAGIKKVIGRSKYAWVEIDLSAIESNINALKSVAQKTKICGVVKANAYGHGAVEVARRLKKLNAKYLAVSCVEEAAELRDAGIKTPILLLYEPPGSYLKDALALGVVPTVHSYKFLNLMLQVPWKFIDPISGKKSYLPLHVKVDTGMHRLGASFEEAGRLIDVINNNDKLHLEGIWTHFATADDPNNPYLRIQLKRFNEFLLKTGIEKSVIRHCANTPAFLLNKDTHMDMARIGLAIYGLYPNDLIRKKTEVILKPAMSLKAKVVHVQRITRGEGVSYGHLFVADSDCNIATLAVGYADGIPRVSSDRAEVLIKGRRYKVAGNITMDLLTVNCKKDDISFGEEAVLIGVQGNDCITCEDWANWSGTINYEIVSRIGSRLERKYLK